MSAGGRFMGCDPASDSCEYHVVVGENRLGIERHVVCVDRRKKSPFEAFAHAPIADTAHNPGLSVDSPSANLALILMAFTAPVAPDWSVIPIVIRTTPMTKSRCEPSNTIPKRPRA
jgi:hypothetical protein